MKAKRKRIVKAAKPVYVSKRPVLTEAQIVERDFKIMADVKCGAYYDFKFS